MTTNTTDSPPFRVFTRKNMAEIPQLQALPESERVAMSAVSAVLPFRVNQYVLDELINWSEVPNDPMFQLTFPQPEMLARDDVARQGAAHEVYGGRIVGILQQGPARELEAQVLHRARAPGQTQGVGRPEGIGGPGRTGRTGRIEPIGRKRL